VGGKKRKKADYDASTQLCPTHCRSGNGQLAQRGDGESKKSNGENLLPQLSPTAVEGEAKIKAGSLKGRSGKAREEGFSLASGFGGRARPKQRAKGRGKTLEALVPPQTWTSASGPRTGHLFGNLGAEDMIGGVSPVMTLSQNVATGKNRYVRFFRPGLLWGTKNHNFLTDHPFCQKKGHFSDYCLGICPIFNELVVVRVELEGRLLTTRTL